MLFPSWLSRHVECNQKRFQIERETMITTESAFSKIESLPDGECELFILCRGLGDDVVRYNPKDKDSLERAARKFEAVTKGERRMAGISVGSKGELTHVKEFDPEAKGHVVVAPISGG